MAQTRRESTRWKVHERHVDDTRRARVSIAEVEMPSGTKFEQWVLRMPRAAIVLVLDDQERVLLLRRHRFVFDRWVWELPGGYVYEGEDPEQVATREVEEETGWRPGHLERLLAFQPLVGTVDSENILFLARGAEHFGDPPDVDEADEVAWVPLRHALAMIPPGEVLGSATVIGLLALAAAQAGPSSWSTSSPNSRTDGSDGGSRSSSART